MKSSVCMTVYQISKHFYQRNGSCLPGLVFVLGTINITDGYLGPTHYCKWCLSLTVYRKKYFECIEDIICLAFMTES